VLQKGDVSQECAPLLGVVVVVVVVVIVFPVP
jgi:hypothetical protein